MRVTTVSGIRIRNARLKAGFTQSELARQVGTSERNIVRWETGANAPRMNHLAAIAQATGTELGHFMISDAEEEEDDVSRLRRIRAELILVGRDDLADDLRRLTGAPA